MKKILKNGARIITILFVLATLNLGFDINTSRVYAAPNSEDFETESFFGYGESVPRTIGDWTVGFIKKNGTIETDFSNIYYSSPYVRVLDYQSFFNEVGVNGLSLLGNDHSNMCCYMVGKYSDGSDDGDNIVAISSASGENFKLTSFKIEDAGVTGVEQYEITGYRDGTEVAGATVSFSAPYGQTTTVTPFQQNDAFKNIDEFRIQYVDGTVGMSFLIDDIVVEDPVLPQATMPTANSVGSTVKSGTNITLTSEEGATIYYTTGTNPADPTAASSSVASGGSIAITGNAGETIKVKAYAVKSEKADSNINTITYTIQSKQALTVTGIIAQNKEYDGNTTAVLTGTAALSGTIQSGDGVMLSGTPTAEFATKDVGDGKAVTVSGYTLTGANVAYYELIQPTGLTANITKKEVTISGVTANNKNYDGTTTATLNLSAVNFIGKIEGDDLTLDTSNASIVFADASVGTGKTVNVSGLKLGGTDKDNYNLSNSCFALTADIEAVKTPPTVITNPVTDILGITAVVEGNISADGGAPITERGVVYAKTSMPEIGSAGVTKVVNQGTNLGMYTVNLTGLMSGSTYYARAYAINSEGISYGTEMNFTITSSVNSVLTVMTEGTGNISVNGGTQTTIITQDYTLGTDITLTAADSENSPFMYWVDANNHVVSTSKTYIFNLASETFLKAVFGTKTSSTHLVVFKNGNGQIIQSGYVDRSSSVAFPASPYMYGYTFTGWDKTSEHIQAIVDDVEVNALFTKNSTKYNVAVTNGTVTNGTTAGTLDNTTGVYSGDYDVKDYVTVTANTAPNGQIFSHWEDSNVKIVCYDTTYKFYVAYDVSLTAIYVADNTIVEQKASIVITSVTKDVSANKMSFVAERIIPEGSTVISHGIILTNNLATGTSEANFKIGGIGVLKGTAKTTGLIGTYVVNKGSVLAGDTWYARGDVIYRDKNGNLVTIYSDIVSETM